MRGQVSVNSRVGKKMEFFYADKIHSLDNGLLVERAPHVIRAGV